MDFKPSQLILANGQRFEGLSPTWQNPINFGEVVFTTGMTGYVESLTDPSFRGQIIVFTYPLIGNYGVPAPETWESKKIHAAGVVVSESCLAPSHADSTGSLLDWLRAQKVPIIMGVDTRALTKILREKGVTSGAISSSSRKIGKFINANPENVVAQVTTPKIVEYPAKGKKIIVVDCGVKENILRSLRRYPLSIKRVPFDYDYSAENFDGIFISNGPGDPMVCDQTIKVLRAAMQTKKPIFGICLGLQLMTLAAGGSTYKLPYGHRGQNQPCLEIQTGRCFITSQNHGYAADAKSLPSDWRVSMTNLNDGSVEGIEHKKYPFFAVQFHPEAAPGPTDTEWLFEKFYQLLK